MTTRLRERLSHGLFRDFVVDVPYHGDEPSFARMWGELNAPYGYVSVRADFAERNANGTWQVHCRGIWVGKNRLDPEAVERRELLGIELWLLLGLGFLAGIGVGGLLVR